MLKYALIAVTSSAFLINAFNHFNASLGDKLAIELSIQNQIKHIFNIFIT
jgi:hypothetical protein